MLWVCVSLPFVKYLMYVYTQICKYACMQVDTYIGTYLHIYIRKYVCMHKPYTNIYMYVHTYVSTVNAINAHIRTVPAYVMYVNTQYTYV